MRLVLERFLLTATTSIGRLSVDGVHECFTLEDITRPPGAKKIPGKTAIPLGFYKVIINKSERFSKLAGREVQMPLLLDVPGFSGIRIHTGNKPEDTEGCILVGMTHDALTVHNSKEAYGRLFAKLDDALKADEEVTIEIKLGAGKSVSA